MNLVLELTTMLIGAGIFTAILCTNFYTIYCWPDKSAIATKKSKEKNNLYLQDNFQDLRTLQYKSEPMN